MTHPTLVPVGDYQRAGFVRDLADLIDTGALTPDLVTGARLRWGITPGEVPAIISEARTEAARRHHPAGRAA